ncbi:uncharacterized protein Sec16 isoform X2 [Diabrotica undecimpunctata]|uniref:uncharacterized protein Sec16 isoform X2 n=1 Tax=Diabrotica undecimpunctata TaxID=50387 RepID=UPI003B640603
MSWMKRRGPSTPSPAPAPAVPMYNPNQHSATQETQWHNEPVQSWYRGQHAQYQPVPKQENTNPPSQNYWQQQQHNPLSYNQNSQYNQHQYQNQQHTGYVQNNSGYEQQHYSNVQYSQLNNQNNVYGTGTQGGQQQIVEDPWNWSWGDEDNSNVQSTPQATITPNQTGGQTDGSFGNLETWNWPTQEVKNPVNNEEPTDVPELFPKIGLVAKISPKSDTDTDISKLHPLQDHLTVTGKRSKLETPQWSTESQMSQESSDDILHTSESDKSHMMSRSSTISHSPISGHDLIAQNIDEPPVKNDIYETKEMLSNVRLNPTPPSPKTLQGPPLLPTSSLTDDSKNPYKRTTTLSHTSASRFRATNITPPDTRQNVYQPTFHNQQINLENADSSEQPDPDHSQSVQKVKLGHKLDNNEAPMNDRNQYLETGQLSEVNYNDRMNEQTSERVDPRTYDQEGLENITDAYPPPGLRRMVPGQLEQTEPTSNVPNFTDEPPPGLSRMVLGQTESAAPSTLGTVVQNVDLLSQFDTSGPPEGLRRMVPGESSSPESSLRIQQQSREDNESEPEFSQLTQHTSQPRSATIGADTPPAVNNPVASQPSANNISRTRLENGTNVPTRSSSVEPDNKRRDSIEGEPQEEEISNITNSVRNMTVGENLTDGHVSNNSLPDPVPRRQSRQESSDSDRESRKPPRGPSRDKKSAERTKRDRDRERDRDRDKDRDKSRRDRERYSPDNYRDKKYERRRYRDRRYEDDTDYYSDKEKEKGFDEWDKDYDRKYNSLRKDKEKERRRRERDPRDYRRDYYYGSRYGDDYENEQRSRPSSRSDSIHESYRAREKDQDRDRRNRDREREKYRRRDPRDVYNYQGFSYDPFNPYYQQYQYYENLRRTNPQAYAEWYRKYYQQATSHSASYGGEDRASVHSGRSSANEELAKDRYTRQSFYSQMSSTQIGGYYRDTHTHSQYALDASSYSRPFDQTDSLLALDDTTTASQRLTPAKFTMAHIKASIASGKLLRILPHYPIDGQPAVVEICSTSSFLANDEEFQELSQFPGPLVKGVTHKKTIIEYCENKIRNAITGQKVDDVESYILMWELLILLIRQNGMVVGADIAELLLKNRREIPPPRPASVISSLSSNNGDINQSSEASNHIVSENTGSLLSVLKEEEITNKFREFLLYGSGKEALEWAMKHSLWGHALFLASKLDKRTYANVMMRFANGLTMNDPLQTLYQLLSGKMPAAVTCVSDDKWGDWRPHLAMILSNSSQRPELNCKAITTLGDTLRNRGSLYAAQFCYLMAEVGFGKYDNPDTRLVLLGADHSKPYPTFATNEAIHMTEIYEFACGLNDSAFVLPHFQVYKYLIATKLVDRGLVEKSLAYLENIASVIVANPSLVEISFVDNVYNLADRLKFYDLVGEVEDESQFGGMLETNRPDNSWLKDLKNVQNDFHAGVISHESMQNLQPYTTTSYEADINQQQQNYENSMPELQQQYEYQSNSGPQQSWQQEQHQPVPEYQDNQLQQQPQQADFSQNQYQDQQNYWSNQQQWNNQPNQYIQESVDQQNMYGLNNQIQHEEPLQPQISLPNQLNAYEDEKSEKEEEKKPLAKPKPAPVEPEKTQSTGWFGGIFSKLALKPKNQMKLPDDKNPKIVWDQDKKRWVNVDEDPNDPANEFKPPPKLSELMPKLPPAQQAHSTPTSANTSLPSFDPNRTLVEQNGEVPNTNAGIEDSGPQRPSQQANMFKLQRGRNLKKSYIDVFNQGNKQQPNSGPASLPAPNQLPSAAPQMNFFVPQQIADPNAPIDFLTPGGVPHIGDPQMSRWSSSSSLSKEVQFYMQQKPRPR